MNAMVYSQTKATVQKSTWRAYKNTGYHSIIGDRLGFVKTTHNLFEKRLDQKSTTDGGKVGPKSTTDGEKIFG
jgi:hypothetical protein